MEVDRIRRELEYINNLIQKIDRMQTKLEEMESKVSSTCEQPVSTEQPLKTRVYEVEQNVYLLANSIDNLEASTKLLKRRLETLKEDFRQFTYISYGNIGPRMQKQLDAGKDLYIRQLKIFLWLLDVLINE